MSKGRDGRPVPLHRVGRHARAPRIPAAQISVVRAVVNVKVTPLAVDGPIEQREIAFFASHLQHGSYRPGLARSQRWFGADELALVLGRAAGRCYFSRCRN
jgi:hypothetical protein